MPKRPPLPHYWVDDDLVIVEVATFPEALYKFVVLETGEGFVAVGGGEHYAFHDDLCTAAAARWPDATVLGGGLGARRFPGTSKAYGAVPRKLLGQIRRTGVKTAPRYVFK